LPWRRQGSGRGNGPLPGACTGLGPP